MNSLSADVQCGNASRSEDGDILLGMRGEIREQNGFACAGFASNEVVVVSVFNF